MCPNCHVKMIPIVYGKLNPDLVDLEKAGKIILASKKYAKGKPRSFCLSCQESFDQAVTID